MQNYYHIGDYLKDEDGSIGVVCIRWNDGDLCSIENDAAHPNPKKCTEKEAKQMIQFLIRQKKIDDVLNNT